MIIPSIDLEKGQTVQLVGGKGAAAVEAGDPRPIAQRFGRVGEIAVVDLDAARGRGDNAALMESLLELAPCRVGGGIRDAETAIRWLDAGATGVVIGTAATPEVLGQLPAERVVAALDALDGEVVVEGWQTKTGRGILERMQELRGLVGGFLVTFVEREGRLGGTNREAVAELVEAARPARVTIAGGITTADEIAWLDGLGADAQVGMALYTGKLDFAEAFAATLVSDRPDGLWPTVVCDPSGGALGLVYSNLESLREALESGRGAYHSRSRGELWVKGLTSGATQELLRIDQDCDRDALRFTVRQTGSGFCHHNTATCWGAADGLADLWPRLAARVAAAPEGSYTRRLLDDRALLRAKLVEEAGELADADPKVRAEVIHETADLLYFAAVAAARAGVSLEAVECLLDRRALKVTRRPGDAKPGAGGEG